MRPIDYVFLAINSCLVLGLVISCAVSDWRAYKARTRRQLEQETKCQHVNTGGPPPPSS